MSSHTTFFHVFKLRARHSNSNNNGIHVVGISMSKIPIYNRSRTQTSIAIDNSVVVGESRAH